MTIGVLVSGEGSNFEALVGGVRPTGAVRFLVSNRSGVGAILRAKRLGVESLVIEPKNFPDRRTYFRFMTDEFKKRHVDLVCLAGFLLKVEPPFLDQFPGRVLNIHPALLPKFGGSGLWGIHVHKAVLKAGETESGCTVHLVDEEFDHGPVLAQTRVPVLADDTPETLAARVLKEEHILYPSVVSSFLSRP
jgi:phosphoribosylglycinamide formyltransferase-1